MVCATAVVVVVFSIHRSTPVYLYSQAESAPKKCDKEEDRYIVMCACMMHGYIFHLVVWSTTSANDELKG